MKAERRTLFKGLIALMTPLFLFMANDSFGQGKYGETEEDSVACIKQLNLYRDFRDNDEYKKAMPHWKKAVDLCPKASKKLYIDGEDFYEALIEKAKDSVQFVSYVDSLMWVYDKRIEHFGEKAKVNGKKGEQLVKMRKQLPAERLEEGNKLLETSVKELREEAFPSHIGYYYFSLYFLYKDEKIPRRKILLEYLPIAKYIRHNIENPENEKYKKYFQKVGSQADKIFLNLGKCDTLTDLYSNLIEKEELDFEKDLYGSHIFRKELTGADSSSLGVDTKRQMMRAMKKRGCEENELFPRIAKTVHEEDPSPGSAFEIGLLEMEKENHEEAGSYFEEAIELANKDTSGYNEERLLEFYIAAGRNANDRGRYSKAHEYAEKARGIYQEDGRAYVIMADAIANSSNSCGENKMDKGAHFWLAADYLQKAEQDTSISDVIESKLGSYRSQFPDKSTMFEYGLLDDNEEPVNEPYEIGCWINESTRPRRSW